MDAFYWDINDETKAWSQRFMARNNGRPPTAVQAGAYSAVLHYLKAIQAAGTKDAEKVAAKMKELKINDALMKDSYIREDGRVVRDYYLLEVEEAVQFEVSMGLFQGRRGRARERSDEAVERGWLPARREQVNGRQERSLRAAPEGRLRSLARRAVFDPTDEPVQGG